VLDDPDCWHQLAEVALAQGDHQVVEVAYQRTRNFERLSFLYLITGNVKKLQQMLVIAERRKDVSSQFHNALYLGDVESRVKVLAATGQGPMAYLTAVTHGLDQQAAAIAESLGADEEHLPKPSPNAQLLVPPEPICDDQSNWPLLTISRGFFDNVPASGSKEKGGLAAADAIDDLGEAGGAWGDDDLDLDDEGEPRAAKEGEEGEEEDGAGWGDEDDDLDLGLDVEEEAAAEAADDEGFFVAPTRGVPQGRAWTNNSSVVADHVAAGAFDSAMQIMKKQLGIVVFEPFREQFLTAYARSRVVVSGMPSIEPLFFHTHRNWKDAGQKSASSTGGWNVLLSVMIAPLSDLCPFYAHPGHPCPFSFFLPFPCGRGPASHWHAA
jgi:coatomer protein complex subunit alpha (xenin)